MPCRRHPVQDCWLPAQPGALNSMSWTSTPDPPNSVGMTHVPQADAFAVISLIRTTSDASGRIHPLTPSHFPSAPNRSKPAVRQDVASDFSAGGSSTRTFLTNARSGNRPANRRNAAMSISTGFAAHLLGLAELVAASGEPDLLDQAGVPLLSGEDALREIMILRRAAIGPQQVQNRQRQHAHDPTSSANAVSSRTRPARRSRPCRRQTSRGARHNGSQAGSSDSRCRTSR